MGQKKTRSDFQSEIFFWYDPAKRMILYQAITVMAVFMLGYVIVSNTHANLQKQSMVTGFGFLFDTASFDISESLIDYTSADNYLRAFVVGILNTLKVGLVGIVLAVSLGIIIGIARLSDNWLIAKLSAFYIEVMQNIPTLLQLFFWYAIFYQNLPSPRQALSIFPGTYLCSRGLMVPTPEPHIAHTYMLIALLAGLAMSWGLIRWAKDRQSNTGKVFPVVPTCLAITIGLPFLVWLAGGTPHGFDVPVFKGFNFQGGITISPEFIALLLGLVLYTGAFIAEIVRAGIEATSKGQKEAAEALGFKSSLTLRLIVLPQALRIIIPPLISQMLNLIKNSSLAVGIGYPDFFALTNTAINQTGQAVEGVVIIMVVYLSFSLTGSTIMNWYNKKAQLVER